MVGLHWNGVGKQISGTELIAPWTAQWGPTDRVAILGANGSGKSTVLSLLSGQMPPSVGELQSDVLSSTSWTRQVSWASGWVAGQPEGGLPGYRPRVCGRARSEK